MFSTENEIGKIGETGLSRMSGMSVVGKFSQNNAERQYREETLGNAEL